MVYAVSVLAAVVLGLGWVLQQQVAASPDTGNGLPLGRLIRTPLWWAGIAALTAGQSLGGWALQLGPISAAAPLFSANLISGTPRASVGR